VIFSGLLSTPMLKIMSALVMYVFVLKIFVPFKPWLSISMDFITDFPCSNGCIYVVVDYFFKMGHFIPLDKFLSAIETASAFMKEIFRLHGLPNEIISDRGTQFTSKF